MQKKRHFFSLELKYYRVSKGFVKASEAMEDVFYASGEKEKALQVWGMGMNCVDQLRKMTT
ncbi:MAG: hypothetical protein ACI84C_001557 [Flavobacteriales bacterium]